MLASAGGGNQARSASMPAQHVTHATHATPATQAIEGGHAAVKEATAARETHGTGTQFTCCTGAKVQILTPEELRARGPQVLSLLALLVQKYKY
jgi:hypothetical protein